MIGKFGRAWHPLRDLKTTGTGVGELRTIDTTDGKTIVERLADLNENERTLKYALVSGIPATRYEGVMDVRPKGASRTVTWTVNCRPEGQGELIVHTIVATLLETGLGALKAPFGSLP